MRAPIMRKKFGVTTAQRICSGELSSRGTIARPELTAPKSSNMAPAPLRRSMKSALENGKSLTPRFRMPEIAKTSRAGFL